MTKKRIIIFLSFIIFHFSFSLGQNPQQKVPINGKYKLLYKNGKVMEKGHYKNSQKTGVWYLYNENGMLNKKEKFLIGVSQWQIFFEKGKITKIIDKNGKITERSKCGC